MWYVIFYPVKIFKAQINLQIYYLQFSLLVRCCVQSGFIRFFSLSKVKIKGNSSGFF